MDEQEIEDSSFTVRTPDSTILISHIKAIGTSVAVYDTEEGNPISITFVREEGTDEEGGAT